MFGALFGDTYFPTNYWPGEGAGVDSPGVLIRLEIWTDYECASGTRQAILALSSLVECVTRTRVTREDDGWITLAYDAPGADALILGRVVRFLHDNGYFEEWRIVAREEDSSLRRLLTVRLRTPLADLATLKSLITTTTGTVTSVELAWTLSPSAIVANILAFCPTYWSAGTITPTAAVALNPRNWMPLKALRELVTAIRAQGESVELDYDRDGTTGYRIHLVASIGSTAAALDVRSAKNLISTRRQQVRDQLAAEVVPLGATENSARITMARGWIEVTAKATNVLTVRQPVTHGDLVLQDDQWNGLYLIDDTGARVQITDCAGGATQTLTVSSGTNFTAGRWYRYALNSSGDDLIRLRALEASEGQVHVVEDSAYDVYTNVIDNPAMADWTGAVPATWTHVSGVGTITKTTTAGLWVYGGQSARVQGTVVLDSSAVSLYVPTWATGATFSMWIYVTASGGASATFIRFREDATNVNSVDVNTLSTGAWVRVDYQYAVNVPGAVHNYTVRLDASGGADVYVDAAQVTFSAAAQAFREGSHPTRLLAIANRYLSKYKTAPEIIDVTFADLGQWDPDGFPYEAVSLGQTVNVRDLVLDLTTSARLMELQRDWKQPLKSLCTISSTPETLTLATT